jgi:uncharacterized protein YacL (UPF0231 family)
VSWRTFLSIYDEGAIKSCVTEDLVLMIKETHDRFYKKLKKSEDLIYLWITYGIPDEKENILEFLNKQRNLTESKRQYLTIVYSLME